MYEWPKGASGTAWEGGPSSVPAGSGAAGRAAGLRAQTTGGPEADGAARARRQAELRKARVLAAGGERMKQVSGQGGAAGSAGDGRRRRKKRAKRRMPAFLRNAHNLEPEAAPQGEDEGDANAASAKGASTSQPSPSTDDPSTDAATSAAATAPPEPTASLRSSTMDPSAMHAAASRKPGVPTSFSNSLRKRSRKHADGSASSAAAPEPEAWAKTEADSNRKQAAPFLTPVALGRIEFFSRVAVLLASGFFFAGDLLVTLGELEAGAEGEALGRSETELLTLAMEEQPTNYVVLFVLMLCCTVTCAFAAVRAVIFPMASSRRAQGLPEAKLFDGAVSTVQLMLGKSGSSLSTGFSLVLQILSAARAFFDDVCVFAIGVVAALCWARSGIF